MSQERDELVTDIMQHPWLPDHEGLYTGLCPSCPERHIHGGHNSPSHAEHLADALLAVGWVKPEFEWATQYTTEPHPIRAISEESAREMAAMTEGVQLLKRHAVGKWVTVPPEDQS
mgnify:CR=1 FL=1